MKPGANRLWDFKSKKYPKVECGGCGSLISIKPGMQIPIYKSGDKIEYFHDNICMRMHKARQEN